MRTTAKQKLIAKAIQTAAEWHSDKSDGIALLSISSTRTVHSEEHRQACLADINRNIAAVRENSSWYPEDEIDKLQDLAEIIQAATIKVEWLSDAENQRINDELYHAGIL